jgi:hypothetical protein
MHVQFVTQHVRYLSGGQDDHPIREPPLRAAAPERKFSDLFARLLSSGDGSQVPVPVRPGEGVERLLSKWLVAVLPELAEVDVHVMQPVPAGVVVFSSSCTAFLGVVGSIWTSMSSPRAGHHSEACERYRYVRYRLDQCSSVFSGTDTDCVMR